MSLYRAVCIYNSSRYLGTVAILHPLYSVWGRQWFKGFISSQGLVYFWTIFCNYYIAFCIPIQVSGGPRHTLLSPHFCWLRYVCSCCRSSGFFMGHLHSLAGNPGCTASKHTLFHKTLCPTKYHQWINLLFIFAYNFLLI